MIDWFVVTQQFEHAMLWAMFIAACGVFVGVLVAVIVSAIEDK